MTMGYMENDGGVVRTAIKALSNLDIHEAAKLLRPAPEGYKYEVRLVRKAEADVVPIPGYDHTANCGGCSTSLDPVEQLEEPTTRVTPFDPTKKYEYKGLTCDTHAQQAHRRERNATGPWTCVVCSPE